MLTWMAERQTWMMKPEIAWCVEARGLMGHRDYPQGSLLHLMTDVMPK